MNEHSVFEAVSLQTDFSDFDDILTMYKGIKKSSATTTITTSMAYTPTVYEMFQTMFFQIYKFDTDIALFVNDASLPHKLEKSRCMVMDTLDKTLLRKLKLIDTEIQECFEVPAKQNLVPLLTYSSYLKKMNTVYVVDDVVKFITVSTDDSFVDVSGFTVTYNDKGFYSRKVSTIKSRYENLKKLLVKDLKDIAFMLDIPTTKTIDGKKTSLHKQELLSEIEAKVSFT